MSRSVSLSVLLKYLGSERKRGLPRARVLWESLCWASACSLSHENSQARASHLSRPEVDAAKDKLKGRNLF